MDNATELRDENRRLRERMAQMEEEISEVHNQDVTIKALKDKLRQYEFRCVCNGCSTGDSD